MNTPTHSPAAQSVERATENCTRLETELAKLQATRQRKEFEASSRIAEGGSNDENAKAELDTLERDERLHRDALAIAQRALQGAVRAQEREEAAAERARVVELLNAANLASVKVEELVNGLAQALSESQQIGKSVLDAMRMGRRARMSKAGLITFESTRSLSETEHLQRLINVGLFARLRWWRYDQVPTCGGGVSFAKTIQSLTAIALGEYEAATGHDELDGQDISDVALPPGENPA